MRIYLLLIFFFLSLPLSAQSLYSPSDTLKGGIRPERTSFDVHFYDLSVKVAPSDHSIQGSNTIHFSITEPTRRIQLDLYAELDITHINSATPIQSWERLYGAIFINFKEVQPAGSRHRLTIAYEGKPQIAKRPPWDGGFVWQKDKEGRDWIATAVQGEGASLWWPSKELLSDEPDSFQITCSVPEELTCISNGELARQERANGWASYTWKVSYPINVYNVALNIGHFVNISDTIETHTGTLHANYYVLDYKEEEARAFFPSQVQEMFTHYEKILGAYPFRRDGFALVDVPYWGMEHQSAVAYGNGFEINEYGFDFILIHESGHEYFGNSISAPDPAELWIHEAFTTYLEVLFLESRDGYDRSLEYLKSKRKLIENNRPVLGPKGVYYSDWVDADMYYKGAWMLHSLRHTINDDTLWHRLIRDYFQTHAQQIVDTDQVIDYFEKYSGRKLKPIFNHYLTELDPPVLSYRREGKSLSYCWEGVATEFNMPIEIKAGRKSYRLNPGTKWQTISIPSKADITFAQDKFYFVVHSDESP